MVWNGKCIASIDVILCVNCFIVQNIQNVRQNECCRLSFCGAMPLASTAYATATHSAHRSRAHIRSQFNLRSIYTHRTHIQHGLTTVECDINYVYGLAHETSTSSAQHTTTTTTCAFVRRRPHTSLISVHCLWLSTAKLLPFGSVLHVVLLTRQQKKYNKST